MKLIETKLSGAYIIDNYYANDKRGSFVKIYNEEEFTKHGLETKFAETYYSVSNKDVIRGMHFQSPPYEHNKIVHVLQGAVIDVVLDIRKNSKTYGKYVSYELNSTNKKSLYIPKGMAHGFVSLENNTIMLYEVSSVFNATAENGIDYNSIGFNWNIDNPILSERDKTFAKLKDYISPFKY